VRSAGGGLGCPPATRHGPESAGPPAADGGVAAAPPHPLACPGKLPGETRLGHSHPLGRRAESLEGLFSAEQPHAAEDWELAGGVSDDGRADDLRSRAFAEFLRAQDEEAFDGSFSDYLDELGVEAGELFPPAPPPEEQPAPRAPGEAHIPACLDRVHDSGSPSIFRTELRSEDGALRCACVCARARARARVFRRWVGA
jgi:hypothetical protein